MATGSTKKSGTTKKSAKSASSTRKKAGSTGKAKATRKPAASRSASRDDKSVEAFRDALERSVTLSRERIQEVVDDAVKRGRMTRDDANDIVSKLGVPLVVRFPLRAGATEAPLRDKDTLPLVSTDEERAAVTSPLLVAHIDVALDEAGVPTIAGNSMTEYQNAFQIAGIPVDLSSARLDPAVVASLAAADIQIVQAETEPEGLYLYLNGSTLPNVAWDQERIDNAIELYSQLEPDSPYLPILRFLAPYIQPADMELALFLPTQAGGQSPAPRPFIKP